MTSPMSDAMDAAKRMKITDPTILAVFTALYDEDLSDAGYLGQDWCKRLSEKVAAAIAAKPSVSDGMEDEKLLKLVDEFLARGDDSADTPNDGYNRLVEGRVIANALKDRLTARPLEKNKCEECGGYGYVDNPGLDHTGTECGACEGSGITARPATAGSDAAKLASAMLGVNLVPSKAPTPAAVVTREQMLHKLLLLGFSHIQANGALDVLLPLLSGATVAVDRDKLAAWYKTSPYGEAWNSVLEEWEPPSDDVCANFAEDLITSGLLSATPEVK